MPSSTFAFFDEFGSELLKGSHNFTATTGNALAVYLTNSAVDGAADTTRAAHTVISTNGGAEIAITASTYSFAETGAGTGVWRLSLAADRTWTATGAGFTFRYIVLDNTTANKLIGFWDYGASQAVAVDETVTLDLDANTAAFTLTV